MIRSVTRAWIVSMLLISLALANQDPLRVSMGPRLQKVHGLYWENGFELRAGFPSLMGEHFEAGASWSSSRLGSAWNSNAIVQDNWLALLTWKFRPGTYLDPMLQAGFGWFWYDDRPLTWLDNTSPLASLHTGLGGRIWRWPLQWSTWLGYNLITGNGIEGPGTLYPLFYAATLQWTWSVPASKKDTP